MSSFRWWFRSHSTGKLNNAAYWFLALLTALLLSATLSLGWRAAGRLQQDFALSDWFGPHAQDELASNSHFVEFLRTLNYKVGVRKDDVNPSESPLYPAADIQDNASKCSKAGSMFDKPDVKVFTDCVSYAFSNPNKQLSVEERFVFENFAAYVVSQFKDNSVSGEGSKNVQRHLASVLGLSEDAENRDDFDVPWIYVASPNGAVAVFPANALIARRYDPGSRPWWQAVFGAEPQLAIPVSGTDSLLTVPYLDVLLSKPILVRTYISKLDVYFRELNTTQPFIVCVDLHRRDEQPDNELTVLGHRLPATPWKFTLAIASVLSLAFFGMMRWISNTSSDAFVFKRSAKSVYGIVNVKRTAQASSADQSSTKRTVVLKLFFKILGISWEETEKTDEIDDDATRATKELGARRGLEWWRVSKIERSYWRLFGLHFESASERHLGTIELSYTHAILPAARWRSLNTEKNFSEAEAREYEPLNKILELNATGSGELLEIPEMTGATRLLPIPVQLPEWVKSLADAEKLLAPSQQRAYVILTGAKLGELYDKCDVRAVILSGYLEWLLKKSQTDFLEKGRTIRRLVSFPDATAEMDISGQPLQKYQDFLARNILTRVNKAMDIEGIPEPPYDFAILKADTNPAEEMLVVSISIGELSEINRI